MRGEDIALTLAHMTYPGSPPHARGRRRPDDPAQRARRITPACAGKTPRKRLIHHPVRDHPRMRGEDRPSTSNTPVGCGSPPHARGRLARRSSFATLSGITPACAGKTVWSAHWRRMLRDHPRMRGEDFGIKNIDGYSNGSPPHARGRLVMASFQMRPRADHPRMRGEDVRDKLRNVSRLGSPPHARGRHETILVVSFPRGITPACAGKTVRFPRESGKVVFQLTSFLLLST